VNFVLILLPRLNHSRDGKSVRSLKSNPSGVIVGVAPGVGVGARLLTGTDEGVAAAVGIMTTVGIGVIEIAVAIHNYLRYACRCTQLHYLTMNASAAISFVEF
jgi:hypothetical protein